ncbi:two-component system response regulator KdpE [Ideonella sp.]|uniref:two-component system response regulator KdpE n=1 Tax=Ideonella sp. TaxID=1929293 RepID=UPI002B45BF62|nr:two-component system response regulator KdpE [Ideonella sp.]HJV68796.1 two-component system response regulator KdpE [Ideonella sp.]
MSESRQRILVVEDEAEIRRFVCLTLEREGGFEVFEADCVKRGLIEAGTRRPDFVVLDLGLPDGDGVDLIRDLRTWSDVPILVLSARTSEDDKIEALDAGADDYLVKPFSAGELLARVRAHLRRRTSTARPGESAIEFGEVKVDLARRTVQRAGEPLHLTPIEYRLLTHLTAHPHCVITHRQLLRSVWGPSHAQDTHYLRVYMGQLRKKIEIDPAQPRHLLTETGIGYRFVP